MTVQTPEPGPAPDFAVKENGLDASGQRFRTAGAAAAIAVAIDTSNSMAGQKIRSTPRPPPRGSSRRSGR